MESVLITGAARRLGSLIAADLAASGCFVWIHYHTHENDALALRDKIRSGGGLTNVVSADLTDTGQIDSMLKHIGDSQNGELTTLINNASVFLPGSLGNSSPSDWDQIMNTNLKAVWYLSCRFAADFSSAKRIINIGDASVSGGYAGHAIYGLSKYALKYLTEQTAVAYAPKVRANLLSPGMVLPGETEPEEVWKSRTNRTVTDNSGIIESVLSGIRFLMNDPGMTGAEVVIDNGVHLHNPWK